MPNFDGITAKQTQELLKSSDRKLDVEGQWFQLWRTVFPGQPQPQTAFLNSYPDDVVSLLKEIWSNRRGEILARVLDGRAMEDSPVIDGIMDNIFDIFTKETAWPHSTGIQSNCTALSAFDASFVDLIDS